MFTNRQIKGQIVATTLLPVIQQNIIKNTKEDEIEIENIVNLINEKEIENKQSIIAELKNNNFTQITISNLKDFIFLSTSIKITQANKIKIEFKK